jgi:DNA-binding transcriptional MerR regulator
VTWSITEVARAAGVTSRTLRHYDAVGLLAPAYVAANGYRVYEDEQLLRLQQILLLRELGLGLDTIAEVLAGRRDGLEALRGHERWLRGEQERLSRVADTVARTVRHLEEGRPMSGAEMFEGFSDAPAEVEEVLVARFGEGVREHLSTAAERTRSWTRADRAAAGHEFERLDAAMLAQLRAGTPPDGEEVFDVLDQHYRAVTEHWTPDRTSYAGLGRLYAEEPRFRARYDALDPALAEYYRDAMAAYAERRLT